GDGEHDDGDGNGGLPDEIGRGDEERRRGQDHGEAEPREIADQLEARAPVLLVARREIALAVPLETLITHDALPRRYTTEKTATQMMSSACQNSAKQRNRRSMSARNPFANTWAIMVSSQRIPAETCRP